jgi:hypothetical protein
MARPVHELVRDDGVARRVFFLQAADRGRGQDRVATQDLESADVRPVVDLRRREAMPAGVPRKESDRHAAEIPGEVGV